MKRKSKDARIDAYQQALSVPIRQRFIALRSLIAQVAPDAIETISYGIPTFDMNGVHLVHIAAFKNHIGFFPTASPIIAFREELESYETSRGTIRFPHDKRLPLGLVKRIVLYRLREVSVQKRVGWKK